MHYFFDISSSLLSLFWKFCWVSTLFDWISNSLCFPIFYFFCALGENSSDLFLALDLFQFFKYSFFYHSVRFRFQITFISVTILFKSFPFPTSSLLPPYYFFLLLWSISSTVNAFFRWYGVTSQLIFKSGRLKSY